MAYPYDREFFDPHYPPHHPQALPYDFYSLPPPPPQPLPPSGDHLSQEALSYVFCERIRTYRVYQPWRTTAADCWRTAPWTPIENHNHYGEVKPIHRTVVVPEPPSTKPFRCQICGKCFSQAANLTAHNRVHTGEKPFECNLCNRPFSQSSSLVTHRRTHTGERPYPCKHCDKAFTDSSTLTKHLRTHTGQKPYGCPLCSMRFTQSGNLHRHMKTHKH